jgi:hypothetical protein
VLGLVNDCDGLGHGLSGAVSGCYVIRGEWGGIAPLGCLLMPMRKNRKKGHQP